MTNAELIAKIKAQIELLYDAGHDSSDRWDMGWDSACEKILDFIYTLEPEKPMNQDEVVINGHKVAYDKDKDAITMAEIPNDLEEAANKYGDSHNATIYSIRSVAVEAFIAGAKWIAEK